MINWNVTKEETNKIHEIAKRALSEPAGRGLDMLSLEMDITACHVNGNPLRLDDLLHADHFNFWHDINGISNTMNRKTGKIDGVFSPRYSLTR